MINLRRSPAVGTAHEPWRMLGSAWKSAKHPRTEPAHPRAGRLFFVFPGDLGMKVRVNFNNRLTTLAGAIAITLCSGASANPPASSLSLLRNAPAIGAAVVREGTTGPQLHLNVHAQRSRYTVILKDEPVATYDGLVSGYPKISRSAKNGRLDVKSKEAVNYANYLVGRQNQFLSVAGAQLKRPLGAIMQFQHAVNGVVVELSAAEAAEVAKLDGVLLVDEEKLQPLLTNRSTFFIGADKIWDGSATGGLATQ